MGICLKSQSTALEGGFPLSNVDFTNAYSTISNCFRSPVSVFLANEWYPGLPSYECQQGSLPLFSRFAVNYGQGISSNDASQDQLLIHPNTQSSANIQSQESLCFGRDLPLGGGEQDARYSAKPCTVQYQNLGRNEFPFLPNSSQANDSSPNRNLITTPKNNRNPNLDPCNPSLPQARIHIQSQKQFLKGSSRPASISCASHVSSQAPVSNKRRIRWTQDLHEKFVESVKCLGGAENATPKAILKLMKSDELTIFHVKSHLQKYRFAKFLPDSAEGKTEDDEYLSSMNQIQQNLQKRIEEQGERLKQILDQQQKAKKNLFEGQDTNFLSQEHKLIYEDVRISNVEGSEMTRSDPR
ncbi:hypothetical protein Sjap_002090 [Stephania japonica]|uniref:Myb-like domain-containing protein n=1 Tax=Stephania japonica TaxID=461633 RepID=A0AAP0KM42_9MAGN